MASFALGQIGQVARNVRDIGASTAWYRNVLGLNHSYQFGELSFFDCDGLRLYLQQNEALGSDSILYFRVEDISEAHAGLSERGVLFVQEPQRVHRHADGSEEWMAFFSDLEGRPLAIMALTRG